jgi:hypothetical protein
VSVTRPDFYKQRFLSFFSEKIFPKITSQEKTPQSSKFPVARPASPRLLSNDVPANAGPSIGVSPSGISIMIDANVSAGGNKLKHQETRVEEINDEQAKIDECFLSPESSVLTHDLMWNGVSPSSEAPASHPPVFSTPTQLKQPSTSSDRLHGDSLLLDTQNSTVIMNSKDNHITTSLNTDSKGIISVNSHSSKICVSQFGYSSSFATGQHSACSDLHISEDSRDGEGVGLHITELEDSSLNPSDFVGDVPSELQISTSLLSSRLDSSQDEVLLSTS